MSDFLFFYPIRIPQTQEGQVEVEVRFRTKKENKYITGVEWYQFDHLKNNLPSFSQPFELDEKRSSQYTVWSFSDEKKKSKKSSVSTRKVEINNQTFWYTKKKLLPDQNNNEYKVKLSVSQETLIEKPEKAIKFDIKRIIQRTSYFNGLMYLDLSVVKQTNLESQKEQTTYEVELEYTDSSDPQMIENLDQYTEVFWLSLYQSNQIYTQASKEALFSEINRFLYQKMDQKTIKRLPLDPRKSQNRIERFAFTQLRNLQLRDLVFGGIIGGPIKYRLAYKTDGTRKLLVINETGYWLAGLNGSLRLLLENDDPRKNKKITIIEGEFTESNEDRFFWMFDCLAAEGKSVTQISSHHKRLQHAGRAIKRLVKEGPLYKAETFIRNLRGQPYEFFNSKGISKQISGYVLRDINFNDPIYDFKDSGIIRIVSKSFRQFHQIYDFFELTELMLNNIKNQEIPYSDDGLVVIPENTVYNTNSSRFELRKRNLTDYPDICKWKPLKKITIDFSFQRSKDGTVQLYSWDNLLEQRVPFEGSFFNPLPASFKVDTKALETVPEGTVVEFAWQNETFVPERIRPDKPQPNNLTIAQDNWDLIQDPITEDILTGRNHSRLVRKYHNRIKRDLFSSVQGRTLLDIGSGRGGDINRWKKFDKILAVEPDSDNLFELEERLEKHSVNDQQSFERLRYKYQKRKWDESKLTEPVPISEKVHVIQAGGQDTDLITTERKNFIGERVDVISLMLSMSFFWSSKEQLQKLAQTIKDNLKPNGTVIFLTIDGQKLDEYSASTFHQIQLKSWAFQGGVEIKYDTNQERKTDQGKILYTRFPDTIVGLGQEWQQEYAVYLNELSLMLANFRLTARTGANKELFLHSDSKKFSSLYTYGSFRFVQEDDVYDYFTLNLTEYLKPLNLDIKNLDEKIRPKTDQININGQNYTREATVTGDSCIFHCLSQALMLSYQKASTYREKMQLAWKLRHDIAETTKDYKLWETKGRAVYRQIEENNQFDQKLVYSQLFSSQPVGPEHYFYTADLCQCNILILRVLTDGQIDQKLEITNAGVNRWIVLTGFQRYYSLIQNENNLIWTREQIDSLKRKA